MKKEFDYEALGAAMIVVAVLMVIVAVAAWYQEREENQRWESKSSVSFKF